MPVVATTKHSYEKKKEGNTGLVCATPCDGPQGPQLLLGVVLGQVTVPMTTPAAKEPLFNSAKAS
jgi:hypothetical protein